MPDLDQIKQGEQGAWDWRERLPKGRSGSAGRSPRPRQPRRGRERDAVFFRFAASNRPPLMPLILPENNSQ